MNMINPAKRSLTTVSPVLKAVFMLLSLTVSLCAVSVATTVTLIVLHGCILVWGNDIPKGKMLKLMAVQMLFVAVGLVPALIRIHPDSEAQLWAIRSVGITQTSVHVVLQSLMRCCAGIVALNVFAFSTPVFQLVQLLRRVGVPDTVTDLFILIYNNIKLLFTMAEQMMAAQKCRLAYAGGANYRQAGQLLTGIFSMSLLKSHYLQHNMEARCYDGSFRLLEPRTQTHGTHSMYYIAMVVLLVQQGIQLFI